MIVIAKARFARIAPRKARYLRDVVVNNEAESAIKILDHLPHKSAKIIKKVIQSALANAQQKNPDQKYWYVKNLIVDEGPKLKRLRSAPMGRAVIIMKKMSHITVMLEELEPEKVTKKDRHGSKGKSNRS